MSANKVGTETRAKVIEYQTECADVLIAHFFGSTALVASADLDTVAAEVQIQDEDLDSGLRKNAARPRVATPGRTHLWAPFRRRDAADPDQPLTISA